MKLNGSWQRALIGFLVFLMAMPVPLFAQSNIPVFRQEELDQILAPIALYPDSLLAQILMASTYPIEVVQADRWVKAVQESAAGCAQRCPRQAELGPQREGPCAVSEHPFHDEREDRLDPECGGCLPCAGSRRHGFGPAAPGQGIRSGEPALQPAAGRVPAGRHHRYRAGQPPGGLCAGIQPGRWSTDVGGILHTRPW